MAAIAEPRDENGARSLDIDLPADREYGRPEDERLDAALVRAIEAARDADNEYLVNLLETELGALYYESRLGK